jgi:hypothetical protein
MTKRFFYSFAVLCLAAAGLSAGQPITVQIPFPFHVGEAVLPAGSYTANTGIASGGILSLRSTDGKASVMVISNGVVPQRGPNPARLIFNRYGNEYFLFQVWTGSGSDGRQVLQSRHEAEIAAAIKRNVEAVVASSR